MGPISAIGSNPAASRTARLLAEAFIKLQQNLTRLASGKRIVSPDVDAAGLAQLKSLNSQVSQIDAGSSNATNAVSFTEVQSGAVRQLVDIENRKGELALRAQDFTLTDSDRQALQAEFATLQDAQNAILSQRFNDVPLFAGSDMQVAADGEGTTVTLSAMNLGASVGAGGIAETTSGATSVSNAGNAASALDTIRSSLANLAQGFAELGAGQSQLNITRETNAVRIENLTAAASRIGDADIAQASADLSRSNAAVQAGIFGLRGANDAARFSLNVLA